jgi:2,4-dienoyl-CoA reductase-like NADH-dependent reductase (Old Yellow Enzyme family)/thioredoxin reductase
MPEYRHLLSPIKVGNVVLKNRMIASNALPHCIQGPETYPPQSVMEHMIGLARNGVGIVTFHDWSDQEQRKALSPDISRFPMYDLSDPSVHNYLSMLAESIHWYGAKVSLGIMHMGPKGYEVNYTPAAKPDLTFDMRTVSHDPVLMSRLMKGDVMAPSLAVTEEKMAETAEEIAQKARFYQKLGWDMVTLHMAYRTGLMGMLLSARVNKRTDEYGGSIENRARFPLAVCRRIKEVCGQDFLIEALVSGEEDGGTTLDETVTFAKLAEGLIDILQLRAKTASLSMPIGYNSREGEEPSALRYAEAVKKSGARIITSVVGGFQDPADNDAYIAAGKVDLIAMARAFYCDPEYFTKIDEGRAEDIVPCIRCNRCHGVTMEGPWLSLCSVNPVMGLAHLMDKMVSAPKRRLKVAVVGGGPAGLEAAMVAAKRGHEVTLYEKNGYLGGQLFVADVDPSKWPLRRFKDYLVNQVTKAGVNILLNTPATPGLIRDGEYDAVLVGLGAVPNIPDIPGAEGAFVRDPLSVYRDPDSLGKRVVVIGGSDTGTETGMFLAARGHDVTVITRQEVLAPDATPIHYVEILLDTIAAMDNFHTLTRATTTSIAQGRVTYRDAEGAEHTIETDDVVLSGGMRPLTDEALEYYGSARRFFVMGDCSSVGDVRTTIRSAYAAASQL